MRWVLGIGLLLVGSAAWAVPCAPSGNNPEIDCRRGVRVVESQLSPSAIGAYQCGTRPSQPGPEATKEIVCDRDEWVRVSIRNLSCDVDFYVFADVCDSTEDCEAFNTDAGSSGSYEADLYCEVGRSFFVVLEFRDLATNPGRCPVPSGSIFATGQADLVMVCPERCDDTYDNDRDGFTDCPDPDCCGDVACPPTAACCDVDNDGEFADDSWCGGPDCHDGDGAINTRATEVVADGFDQDCDGVDDCYQDLDLDTYGSSSVVRGDDLVCDNLPGEADNDDDCLDANTSEAAGAYPGATEVVGDGIDQDCDGVDSCYVDADGDGLGGSVVVDAPFGTTCAAAPGLSASTGDCVDTGPGAGVIRPGAPEICDPYDNDCDGLVNDADDDRVGGTPWYSDVDGDTIGRTAGAVIACAAPPGRVAVDGDCDDTVATGGTVFPGADEVVGDGIDQDCDGVDRCYVDGDGDGVGGASQQTDIDLVCGNQDGLSSRGDDCDETGPLAASRFPGAAEVCNGVDDDCDGLTDDADDDVVGAPSWWSDADGDTWGAGTLVALCVAPAGHVDRDGDCDDAPVSGAGVFPGAPEVCNAIDDDCDELVDDEDALDETLRAFVDADGDGYGAGAGQDLPACAVPDGYAAQDGDCDDAADQRYPGAAEVPYDGFDDNCDGVDLVDVDGDGAAGPRSPDCHDGDASILPGAAERADGIDQDCDGVVDEGTDWGDDDDDGVAEEGGDCDDTRATVRPGAVELANGVDDDCDGVIDEGTDAFDDDRDGWSEDDGDCRDDDPTVYPGAPERPGAGLDADCDGTVDGLDGDGDGVTPLGGDCDDADPLVRPGAAERVNGVDDDCDGVVDEGTDAFDDDGDGVSEDQGDCHDGDATVGPAATERIGNFLDDDCDGVIDEGSDRVDDDGDGFAEDGGDCDDTDPSRFPNAAETANELDDDCDGQVDEDFVDIDEDGFRTDQGDCDDRDGWASPDQVERCDDIDNDCDGTIDEGCDDEPPAQTPSSSSCATGAGPRSIALLALLAIRRRRG